MKDDQFHLDIGFGNPKYYLTHLRKFCVCLTSILLVLWSNIIKVELKLWILQLLSRVRERKFSSFVRYILK